MYETKIWIDCRLQKYLELQDDEERQKHCWEREGDDGDGHKIPDRYKIVTKQEKWKVGFHLNKFLFQGG